MMIEMARRVWPRWHIEQRLRSGEPLHGPRWVHLGIADGCNYRCSWCRLHSCLLPTSRRRHDLLPRGVLDGLLEDLAALGTRLAEFGGVGEPLVHPEAMPMIRATKQAGLEVLLITNGSLLTEAVCEELVEVGVDTINISLNAAREESHTRLHCARAGDFHRILAMLRHLRQARRRRSDGKPRLHVSTVVQRENYAEIPALTELARQLEVDFLYFAPLGMNEASVQLALSPAQEEEARAMVRDADAMLQAAGQQTNAATYLDRPRGLHWTKQLLTHLPCDIGQVFSRVLGTGEVYPCATNCWHSLGNLADMRFRDIWHSENYRRFRRESHQLPRRRQQLEGCQCWTCMQHFLLKQYHERVRLGQVAAPPRRKRYASAA